MITFIKTAMTHPIGIMGGIMGGIFGLIVLGSIVAAILDMRKHNKEIRVLFPNCPFKIKKGEGQDYFILQDDLVGFELDHGTKLNGIRGVVGINLSDWPSFRDGMDMLRLWKEVNELVDYLKKQGYYVREENNYLQGIQHEVNQIDNFAYIEAKKEGRV
jgi:hypothetical protein